jgi:hypothetical protein
MMTPTNKRVQGVAYTILLIMGLVAFIALYSDISNFISSEESSRGLGLEITDIKVVDDENPRALIRLKVRNGYRLELKLDRYMFDLYLGNKFIGSNGSMYLGTDPNVDPLFYIKSQVVKKVLKPGQTIDLTVTLFIYPGQINIVRQAQSAGASTWRGKASVTILLPYYKEETHLRLGAVYKG